MIILDLAETAVDLDSRVMVIEENGNQTISELDFRVETLEGTAADHETRISTAEFDVNGKEFLKVLNTFAVLEMIFTASWSKMSKILLQFQI